MSASKFRSVSGRCAAVRSKSSFASRAGRTSSVRGSGTASTGHPSRAFVRELLRRYRKMKFCATAASQGACAASPTWSDRSSHSQISCATSSASMSVRPAQTQIARIREWDSRIQFSGSQLGLAPTSPRGASIDVLRNLFRTGADFRSILDQLSAQVNSDREAPGSSRPDPPYVGFREREGPPVAVGLLRAAPALIFWPPD